MPAYRDNPFDVNNHSEVDLNNYYDDAPVSRKVTARKQEARGILWYPEIVRHTIHRPCAVQPLPLLFDRFPSSFLPCFRETTPLTNLC